MCLKTLHNEHILCMRKTKLKLLFVFSETSEPQFLSSQTLLKVNKLPACLYKRYLNKQSICQPVPTDCV